LYLTQVRTDYEGAQEVDITFPHLNVVSLLNGARFGPLPSEYWAQPRSFFCNLSTTPGRFVYRESAESLFDKSTLPASTFQVGPQNRHCIYALPTTSYFVDLASSQLVRWEPYNCVIPSAEPTDFYNDLQGLRIDFSGDSHMRILFNHVLKRFCGVDNAA
jgi:hypothetical protein